MNCARGAEKVKSLHGLKTCKNSQIPGSTDITKHNNPHKTRTGGFALRAKKEFTQSSRFAFHFPKLGALSLSRLSAASMLFSSPTRSKHAILVAHARPAAALTAAVALRRRPAAALRRRRAAALRPGGRRGQRGLGVLVLSAPSTPLITHFLWFFSCARLRRWRRRPAAVANADACAS